MCNHVRALTMLLLVFTELLNLSVFFIAESAPANGCATGKDGKKNATQVT